MSSIVQLSCISASEAHGFLADDTAFQRFDRQSITGRLWYNDKFIVEIFADEREVRRTLYQYGRLILSTYENEVFGSHRILLPQEVQVFNSVLAAVDEISIARKCAWWEMEAHATLEELGISFQEEVSAQTSNILSELRQLVDSAVAQQQALLIYWG